ncbi:MAG TPA: hypothetical protein VGQ71_14305 [Terriglobales bacterium]|jgi:hypothetical protein|nr:hypothetical protein [Terriglobales bacterium]
MTIKDIQKKEEARLSRAGIIRLGAKVRGQNGEHPVDFDHFVMTDAPDLVPAYGASPTALFIYLPFATIDENLKAFHELWKASGCVCRGDGEYIVDLIGADGHKVIRDSRVVRSYTENDIEYQKDDTAKCPGLDHNLYPRCADCKPSAILIVMVRDPQRPDQLVGDRLVYYQIRTHSFYNIQNLTGQLAYAAQITERMGRDLRGIPMVLRRVAHDLPYTDAKSGQRKTTTKHLLDLEFDPEWVRWANSGMRAQALGEVASMPALPAPVEHVTGELVEDEPLDVTPPMAEPEPVEDPQVETVDIATAPRPWSPQTLVRRFEWAVERKLEKHPKDVALIDEDAGRKIARQVTNILNGLVSTDEQRHAFLYFLFGVDSSFYLSIARRDVLESWLTTDSPAARTEAEMVMDWLTNQPQAEPETEAA